MSGISPAFVDSNVFLYTIDARNPDKQRLAHDWVDCLWSSGAGRLSWQVLNEFYVNAIRMGVAKRAARINIEALSKWPIAPSGYGILQRAWRWTDSEGVPFWDALILAAAENCGCTLLLSEDFQNGRKFGDVTVVNPFTTSPREYGFAPGPRN